MSASSPISPRTQPSISITKEDLEDDSNPPSRKGSACRSRPKTPRYDVSSETGELDSSNNPEENELATTSTAGDDSETSQEGLESYSMDESSISSPPPNGMDL